MGKNRRAEYDAKRKRMLDVQPTKLSNKARVNYGRKAEKPIQLFGVPRSSKSKPSNYRAPVGFEVNSKGNAIVGSRIYQTPKVNGHVMSEPIGLLDNDTLQVSDLFVPRVPISPIAKQAYRAKRLITPSWVREAGAGDCIMDMYPGERIVPRMYAEPMVYERRVFRSPQHRDHTAWTFSIGAPAVVVDKRNNMPLVKHVIKFHACTGTLPPMTYVDTRAVERARLQALVDAWAGAINLDLVAYLTRD